RAGGARRPGDARAGGRLRSGSGAPGRDGDPDRGRHRVRSPGGRLHRHPAAHDLYGSGRHREPGRPPGGAYEGSRSSGPHRREHAGRPRRGHPGRVPRPRAVQDAKPAGRRRHGPTSNDGPSGRAVRYALRQSRLSRNVAETNRPMSNTSPTALLLNVGHAMDHLFLLIFATAVAGIAAQWGMVWQDLMPYTVGAFVMFGLGSLPAGRLGNLWGRRVMMIIFFLGLGGTGLVVSAAQRPWQLAVALTLMGAFASIYHPVGIPMIVQNSTRPGFTIGLNGLAGNLGIAFAAILTGFLVQQIGWRMAFVVPSLLAIACGLLFALVVPREEMAPAKKPRRQVSLPPSVMARIFFVMSLAAVSGSMIFNFTTNGNNQLLAERLRGLVDNPATLGVLLAVVYAIASLAQIVVGKLIDRYPLKYVYLPIVAAQVPLFALASRAEGWALYALMLLFMVFVFGAIPFIDAMIVQYVDDRMRSRVAGMRLAVSFGVSALAVYLLGPTVKAAGFTTLLTILALLAACTTLFASLLPTYAPKPTVVPAPAPEPAT